MRPIGCPETSVRDYNSPVRNIPKERISQNFDVLEVLCLLSTETGTLLQNAPETPPPPLFTYIRHCIPIRCWRVPVLFCSAPRRCYLETVLYYHLFLSKVCFCLNSIDFLISPDKMIYHIPQLRS